MRLSALWATMLLFVIIVTPGAAQTSTDDIQQLKQRLQQLETMVASLQRQIAAVEQARKTAPPPPAPQPAPGTALPPRLPLTYIGNETRTRQTDDDFPVEAPRIDNEELDPTLKGYFRLPGTQTLIRLRGFVKTDFFYDTSFAGLWYGGMVPSSFPSSPQPDSRDSTVSIRPSRFSVEFRQPLGGDTLKGFIDWDLYGTFGRNTPNVRSFWGQYKNFLGGQTWSAFGDPDAFPDTLDFHGPPGMMGLRTPQFRYTYPLNHHHWIGGTVEKPGTDVPFSTLYGTPEPTSTRPDFVGFYRYENNYGHIHAAAIFRSVGGLHPGHHHPGPQDPSKRIRSIDLGCLADGPLERQSRLSRHRRQRNRKLLQRQLWSRSGCRLRRARKARGNADMVGLDRLPALLDQEDPLHSSLRVSAD